MYAKETPFQIDQSAVEVRWLTTLAEVDAFAVSWRALDEASTADLVWFQSFDWCRNWLAMQATAGDIPQILTLTLQGSAIAILPMVKKRAAFGARILESLGQPHTQYSNILTRGGTLTALELEALRKALLTQSGADATILNYVPIHSPLARILAHTTPSASLANTASMLNLQGLGGSKSFESTRSVHAQKRLRRHIRLFEKEFGTLTFVAMYPNHPEYAKLVDDCVEMKKVWLRATGRMGSGLMRNNHAAFLAALSPDKAGAGPVLWVLRGASKLIAAEIGFLQRGHYYCYMSSFDSALWKLSPGKLQKAMTINALADMGAKTFDLMGNPTGYKDDYADTHVALSGYVVNLSLRGALYTRTWTEHMEPLLRQMFYRMPNRFRQSLAAARRLSFS